MLTAVVRNEWGFQGTVTTDYYLGGSVNDIDEGIRAGNTQVLHPDGQISWFESKGLNTTKYYVHKAAKDLLYAYVETKSYAETAQGLESGSTVGVVATIKVIAWWKALILLIDLVVIVLLGVWIGTSVKNCKKHNVR